jgi:hypothetical protein
VQSAEVLVFRVTGRDGSVPGRRRRESVSADIETVVSRRSRSDLLNQR